MFGRKTDTDPPALQFEIERPLFDLSTEPWLSDASLENQLRNQPYKGEGFLYHATTEQLREALTLITKDSEDTQFIQDVATFVGKVHKNDVRKDDQTPYVHHLLRGAIRISLMGFSADMIAAYLLHDTVEDHDITLEQMQKDEGLSKYSDRLAMHHEIATAMSVKRGKKKLSLKKYYQNIDNIKGKFQNIRPWVLKGVDRFDNIGADLSLAIRHGNPRWAAENIRRYRPKAEAVLSYARTTEPESVVLGMLEASWELGSKLMKKHELTDKRSSMLETIRTGLPLIRRRRIPVG